jgi:hypothetical protein
MKMTKILMAVVVIGSMLGQGCIMFPPLVNVESKESKESNAQNQELKKRLDAIDKRLADLEKQQNAEKK